MFDEDRDLAESEIHGVHQKAFRLVTGEGGLLDSGMKTSAILLMVTLSFTAALAVGLLLSPVMWQHYLVLLFVPLAVTGRARDPFVWLLVALLWLSPVESPPTAWQTWLVPLLGSAIAWRAVARPRRARLPRPVLPLIGEASP